MMIKLKKLIFFFASQYFSKEIENLFSVFLSSYRNTRESLGELKKAVEHLPVAHVPTTFLILPNFHSCFVNLTETQYMFSVS